MPRRKRISGNRAGGAAVETYRHQQRRKNKPPAGQRERRLSTMSRRKIMASRKNTESKRLIESYQHKDKRRANNPPVGLVTPQTDPDAGRKKTYAYDPHLDPQLVWAGKAEHTSFDVPTVSLHVHERIDPKTIMEAVRRRNGIPAPVQGSLFESAEENPRSARPSTSTSTRTPGPIA